MSKYLNDGAHRSERQLAMVDREIAEPNRSYVHAYKTYLELNNRDKKTLARRMSEMRFLMQYLPKDAKLATREEIERVVLAINNGKVKDHNGKLTGRDLATISKRKLKQILRAFYKWLYNSDEYPPIVKWIKADRDILRKLPEDMLDEEEVKFLIKNCKNQRDKTIIAVLWDTGMRVGELLNLRMKDIVMSNSVPHVKVDGKTGGRQVPLTFSVPYLANYFNDLRNSAAPQDPLFTTFSHASTTNDPIDYPHICKFLRDLKERSHFEKRLYPHLFRHSRATHYANFLTEAQAKVFFGWSGSSNMMARYVHLNGRDIDQAVLRANGMENDANGESLRSKPSVKTCQKCHEKNEITAKYCVRCATDMDKSTVQGTIDDEIAHNERDKMKEALTLLMTQVDPKIRDEVMKLVKLYNEKTD